MENPTTQNPANAAQPQTPPLHPQLQKRTAQWRLLNEFSTHVQSLVVSDDFFQEVLHLIQSRFSYFSIQIWTPQADGSLVLEAQSGAHVPHLKKGHILPPSQGILGQVLNSRKACLVEDTSLNPHYTDLGLPVQARSELAVPVLREGTLLAIVNIESDQSQAFDNDDLMTLESVTAQLAVAISNQQFYKEIRDFNRKLQAAVEEKTIELRRAHERILEQQALLQKENRALKSLVTPEHKGLEIIGSSPAFLQVLSTVDKVAPTTATVLILGESGTGKEQIARRLHFASDRGQQPFVTVNCGALQESLLESELFGHEKGSFTGAVNQKLGLCETAQNGTLFLDEIGELSLGIQAKLLRFLQEGEFYRIGGKKPIRVNVRIVSATNRDLESEVKAGRFREDLFYRLNTITLRMPSLRQRKEDIPALVEFFLKNSRFGGTSNSIKRVDPRVAQALQAYDWPGNIRELQNAVERLKILAENQEIRLEDLPPSIRTPEPSQSAHPEFSVEMPLELVEKNHILRTLSYHSGNKTRAAQSLGITIKTLYNKLHRYGAIGSDPERVQD